jgi:excisionase family DNA binding protein
MKTSSQYLSDRAIEGRKKMQKPEGKKIDLATAVRGKLLYRVSEAAALLSISRSQGYLMIQRGEIATVRIGERGIRIPAQALIDLATNGAESGRETPRPS